MNPATIAIDFSEMLLVPHPHSLINTYAVNVSASGHIALNQKFYDKLITGIPSLALEFRNHSDRTLLTIRSSEQPNYKFPKGGRIKDPAFTRALVEQGIPLPARYEVAWNQDANAWVGILVESAPAPGKTALSQSLTPPPAASRRGRKQ